MGRKAQSRLLHEVKKESNEKKRARNYAIVQLMLSCGLRVDDLVNLYVNDLDPDRRTIFPVDVALYVRVEPAHEALEHLNWNTSRRKRRRPRRSTGSGSRTTRMCRWSWRRTWRACRRSNESSARASRSLRRQEDGKNRQADDFRRLALCLCARHGRCL
ncbi:tyrosine-type recombinase/integrase [Hydrogenibacillus schlegelii]|uniref:tyrosine-type recombinase/integrase n=1 Tax=Hydrogenibacillus schlegelii TaxID=1484 RepID=UPI003C6D308A